MTPASKQTMRLGALLSFSGRARRLPFALVAIAVLVVWQIPEPVLTVLLLYKVQVYSTSYSAVLLVLACLAWPLACFAGRRLHDAGLMGWPGLVYLAHFVWILAIAYSNFRPQDYLSDAFRTFAGRWLYDSVSCLLVLTTFVLAVLPGNKGENRYGADPQQASQRAAELF